MGIHKCVVIKSVFWTWEMRKVKIAGIRNKMSKITSGNYFDLIYFLKLECFLEFMTFQWVHIWYREEPICFLFFSAIYLFIISKLSVSPFLWPRPLSLSLYIYSYILIVNWHSFCLDCFSQFLSSFLVASISATSLC